MSSTLRSPSRFITTFDSSGQSIFSSACEPNAPTTRFENGMQISLCYATKGYPIDLSSDADLKTYERHSTSGPPAIVIANGSTAKVVDFPPGHETAMHQSRSVNYNFVIEGEVEVVLDSGEKKILKRGDCLVQRAVNHKWRNTSETEWARITAITLEAKPFTVSGKMVGDSEGGH